MDLYIRQLQYQNLKPVFILQITFENNTTYKYKFKRLFCTQKPGLKISDI